MSQIQLARLARQFSASLLGEIGLPAMRKVIAMNENGAPECHTHDFCDANMVMLEAMILTDVINSGDDWVDAEDDRKNELTALMESAWTLARQNDFYLMQNMVTVGFANDGQNPQGLYAEVSTSGDPGIYDELRVTVFNRHGVAVGDILIGLDQVGALRVATTAGDDGNGDHAIAVYPQKAVELAVEAEPVKAVVEVSGGCISRVVSNRHISYVVADRDTESCSSVDLAMLPDPVSGELMKVFHSPLQDACVQPAGVAATLNAAAMLSQAEALFADYVFTPLTVSSCSGWALDTAMTESTCKVYCEDEEGESICLSFTARFDAHAAVTGAFVCPE